MPPVGYGMYAMQRRLGPGGAPSSAASPATLPAAAPAGQVPGSAPAGPGNAPVQSPGPSAFGRFVGGSLFGPLAAGGRQFPQGGFFGPGWSVFSHPGMMSPILGFGLLGPQIWSQSQGVPSPLRWLPYLNPMSALGMIWHRWLLTRRRGAGPSGPTAGQ